jgi:ABC-2 type transport system permease protein
MTLFAHTLRRLRAQILIFGIGLAVWGALYVLLFPLVQDSMSNIEYPPEILSAFGASGTDLGDPRLFFDVEFFSLAPSVAAIFGVIAGTGALAGEESAGTIDFLASLPMSRRTVFVQKALAVAAGGALITVLVALGWILTSPFAEYRDVLPVRDVVGATLAQLPFILFISASALLLGSVAPNRATAAAWCGVLLLVVYLAVTFAAVTDRLEWLQYLSPYYYTSLPGILEDGLDIWHEIVLWLLIAATTFAALRAWEGRELRADRWQWKALTSGGTSGPHVSTGSVSESMRDHPPRWPPSRRTRAVALLVLILLGAAIGVGTAAVNRGALTIGQLVPLSVSGRIDATGARMNAPTTGVVRLVLAQQGDQVHQGQVVAWVSSALDGSDQPVLAPLDGTLTDFTLTKGQSLAAGAPIGEVHETGRLRAVFELNEGDLRSVHTGQTADLSIPSLGMRLTCEVGSVSGIPISEVGQGRSKPKYEVWCPLVDADSRLAIGMRVNAKFQR